MGETAPSGVLKSPAVTSGSEKQGSEQASSLVAAHPIDQSKVSHQYIRKSGLHYGRNYFLHESVSTGTLAFATL